MKIVVECYGASRRWCGAAERTVDIDSKGTVAEVLELLALRYPDFARRRGAVAVAIGDAVVPVSTGLAEGTRMALIPPVSGG